MNWKITGAALGLVLTLALGLSGWMFLPKRATTPQAPEPVYQGQSLSQWLRRNAVYEFNLSIWTNFVSYDGDKPIFHSHPRYEQSWSKERNDAYMNKCEHDMLVVYWQRAMRLDQTQSAIRAMGSNALPYLMEMLRYDDSRRTKLADVLYCYTPMTSGQRMRLAAPSVASEKHSDAWLGLKTLGPVAVPALTQAIADPNPRVRETAKKLLPQLGNAKTEAESLQDTIKFLRGAMGHRTNAPDTNSPFKPQDYE